MKNHSDFHTLKGYQLQESIKITPSMEDYLEMICRMAQKEKTVRINELAGLLNVKPSSASKMVQNLRDAQLVNFQKYGYITPTQRGWQMGEYMLFRHDILCSFLCELNGTDSELEQVEKIEHFIDSRTILNLERLTQWMKQNKNSR